ncbi:MAG: RHS repeat-associated core domain-containing protein [Candidatus Rokuibacteriota bacterium]
MVATAPAPPSSLAGPSAPGRSASRIASDRRGATEVSAENSVFHHLARRRPEHALATSCIGRPRPHRGNSHRGRCRFSGQTRRGRYSWARYYHPGLQRFISEDPIVFESGDVNLYAYVANDPVTRRDPLGLQALPLPAPVPVPDSPSTSLYSGNAGEQRLRTSYRKRAPGSCGSDLDHADVCHAEV